jgi:hypothetical protein
MVHYQSGEEIKKGDRVLFHDEPGEIEFEADALIGDPAMDWYIEEKGGRHGNRAKTFWPSVSNRHPHHRGIGVRVQGRRQSGYEELTQYRTGGKNSQTALFHTETSAPPRRISQVRSEDRLFVSSSEKSG